MSEKKTIIPTAGSVNAIARTTATSVPSLDTISDEDWKRIALEAQVMDAFMSGTRTCRNAERAADMLEWSVSKFYRKLKAYEEAGHALALARQPSVRTWHSKLAPEVEAEMETSIRKFLRLRKYRGQCVTVLIFLVRKACTDAGLSPPSDRTIRRRWEALDERTRYAHKYGKQAAADKYNRNKGKTPPCNYPLERIQIDHTADDLHLLSEEQWISLGRPTFTMVVDEFSRVPLGFHVTFGYPSVEELAEAMAIACLPKDQWLAAMGIEGVYWPWYGVPSAIFVDRGVDFTSKSFERGCQKWRIALSHRLQAHDGGIVERLIGTAMTHARSLPGNTRFSKTRRQKDRIDPTMTAELTLKQYLAELVRYFVCEYPHKVHEALGMTPAEKWNLGMHQYGDPRRVDDPEAFYLDFLKTEYRKLEKYGLRVSYLDYTSRKLQPLLNQAKSVRVAVKRDPGDVSRAFVEDPRNGNYIELRDQLTEGKSITVAEWEEARKTLKAKNKGRGRKVTALGILGIIEKERKEAKARTGVLNPKSKLDRARQRKAERNNNRRKRSEIRLPTKPAQPAAPVVGAPVVDPASYPILDIRGAIQ